MSATTTSGTAAPPAAKPATPASPTVEALIAKHVAKAKQAEKDYQARNKPHDPKDGPRVLTAAQKNAIVRENIGQAEKDAIVEAVIAAILKAV